MFTNLLRTLLLAHFRGQLPEEDRERYETGKKAYRTGDHSYVEEDVEFYEETTKQVKEQVEKELDAIGHDSRDQFFKACELAGFPQEFCNSKNIVNSIVCFLFHLMKKSSELRSTDPTSPNFIALLQAYVKLLYIFNMSTVSTFLFHYNLDANVLEMLNQMSQKEELSLRPFFNSLLHVDSPEFILLSVQASFYAAQFEQDSDKLQKILSELSVKLQRLQISSSLTPQQKIEYLYRFVPLLITFLDTATWRLSPRLMDQNFRVLYTSLSVFTEEIGKTTSDEQYADILQKKFPASSRIPLRNDLPQFLRKNVFDKYYALKPK